MSPSFETKIESDNGHSIVGDALGLCVVGEEEGEPEGGGEGGGVGVADGEEVGESDGADEGGEVGEADGVPVGGVLGCALVVGAAVGSLLGK